MQAPYRVIVILLLIITESMVVGQEYSWLYYDSELKKVEETSKPVGDKKYSYLLLKEYSNNDLVFEINKGLVVYVEGRLHKIYQYDLEAPIDLSDYTESHEKYLLLTFFHEEGKFPKIIEENKKETQSDVVVNEYIVRERSSSLNFMWSSIAILILLLILTKFFYPEVFYFLFQGFLFSWFKENPLEIALNKSFVTFLLSSFLISICTSLIFSSFSHTFSVLQLITVSSWFITTLLFLISKAVITYLISSLYNYDIHKALILSYSKLLFHVTLTIICLSFLSYGVANISIESIRIIVIILLIFITINQVWHIVNYQGLRKIYLFSYLCTAELIPLLVLIKLL